MRRDYFTPDSDIPEGCVLWLPLAYEGDLTERVTGQQLQFTGDGSMTWDSTEGMYKITTPSTRQYIAGIQMDDFQSKFPTNEYTYLYDLYGCQDGTSGFYKCVNIHTEYDASSSQKTVTSGAFGVLTLPRVTGNIQYWPGNRFKMAWYEGPTERQGYLNGELSNTGAAYPAVLPNNWVIQYENPNIVIGYANHTLDVYNKSIRFKNFMVFNRKLTVEEIRYYQGIE